MDNPATNLVSFYGYVRGTYLDQNQRVHINGIGDYQIASLHKLDDPCPIELKRTVKEKQGLHTQAKLTGQVKKLRNLKDKEKVLYAPFSNIGQLNFDKATGYITIPDSQIVYTRTGDADTTKGNEGQQMVWQMQDVAAKLEPEDIQDIQLLSGIAITEKRATRRLHKPDEDQE
jgi:ribosome biogenesis protein BMS1